MDSKVKEQILAIRKTGLTNMFDTLAVQRIAHERDFFELVIFLEEHKEEYAPLYSHRRSITAVNYTIPWAVFAQKIVQNMSDLVA